MATIQDVVHEVSADVRAEFNSRAREVAEEFLRLIKARVQSGEGQPGYSTNPTWFNVRRVPEFAATLERYAGIVGGNDRGQGRDARGRFTQGARSRYGTRSVFLEGGYRMFREIVGRPTARVDFNLTGDFVASLGARVVPDPDGIRAVVVVEQENRHYGKATNSDIADFIRGRGEIDPFDAEATGAVLIEALFNSR